MGLGTRRTRILVVVVALGLLAAGACWPTTNPRLLHARVQVLGPHFVYGELTCCYGDSATAWDAVLRGVRAGDRPWLILAADMRPALDTHPAEEMVGAVAAAWRASPQGALSMLLPAYGPDLVCGGIGSEEPIGASEAEKRLQDLRHANLDTWSRQKCLDVLVRIVSDARHGTAMATR